VRGLLWVWLLRAWLVRVWLVHLSGLRKDVFPDYQFVAVSKLLLLKL